MHAGITTVRGHRLLSIYSENEANNDERKRAPGGGHPVSEHGGVLGAMDTTYQRSCIQEEETIQQVENVTAFRDFHQAEAEPPLSKLQQTASESKNTFEALMEPGKVCSLGSMSHAQERFYLT